MSIVLDGTVGITTPGLTNTGVETISGVTTIQGITVGKGGGAVATNTAVGVSALAANTSGGRNVAVGISSLNANTTGSQNSALGDYSMLQNTTGAYNSAMGDYAMEKNTTGGNNSAFGAGALNSNTTASNNTAVGYQAGYSQTSSGNINNSFFGYQAGYGVTSGYENTFIGSGAGSSVTSGYQNTILGKYSGNQGGLDIRTSNNYIVLSDGAGNPRGYCTSAGLWYMGDGSSNSGGSLYLNGPNTSNLGPLIFGAMAGTTKFYVGAYSAILGGAANGSLTCQNSAGGGVYLSGAATSWSAASDERRKDIIEPITDAANKVSTLRAVIGKYKTDAEGTRRSFLIAQDVQAVLPEAVNVMEDKDGELLGVQYTDVIPLLVAAIKELKAEIDILKGNV